MPVEPKKAKDGSAIPFFHKQKRNILMSSNCSDHLEVVSEIDGHVIASLNAMRKCASDSWLVLDGEPNPATGKKNKRRIFEVTLADGSKKHITPNNPWNFSENNREYFLRRKQQAQNILAAMEENGKNNHAKNIGIYTVQECGYDHTLLTLINRYAKHVAGKEIEAVKSEIAGMKDLMVVYDKKKYELVEQTPIFKEESHRGESYGGIVYKFRDKVTGKYISVLNTHLAYGKDYEEETEKVVAKLIKNDELFEDDEARKFESSEAEDDVDDYDTESDPADALEQSDLTPLEEFKENSKNIDETEKEARLAEELTKLKGGDKPPYLIVACGDTNGPVAKIKASLAPDGATCSDNLEKESRLLQHQNAKYSDSETPNDYGKQKITHGETADKKTYTETRVLHFQPEVGAKKTIKCKLLSGYCLDSDGSQGGERRDYRGGFLRKYKTQEIDLSQEEIESKTPSNRAPAPAPAPLPTKTPTPVSAKEVAAESNAIAKITEEVTKVFQDAAGAKDEEIKRLYQESLKAQEKEPQPKGPYKGIGVKADVKLMQNDKIGAQIANIFSPELKRFKVAAADGKAAATYIDDPKSLLEGKYITQITKDDGSVVDINALATSLGGMKNPNFLKTLVGYFHGENGNVKMTVVDEKGEKPQTIFCERNEKTVFVGSYADNSLFGKPDKAFKNTQYNPETHGVQILTKFKEMLADQKAKLAALPAPTTG